MSNVNAHVINDIKIEEIVKQSVPKNGTRSVNGKKTFANVQAKRIEAFGLISGYNVSKIYETAVFTSDISSNTLTGNIPSLNQL